jgi:Leucine-rich repeat (LRR) protein
MKPIISLVLAIISLSFISSSNVEIKEIEVICEREITSKIYCELPSNVDPNDVLEITSLKSKNEKKLTSDELKNAQELDLGSKFMTYLIPFEIGTQFPNLEALSIVKSKLRDLENASFANMRQLISLNLYENEIAYLPSNVFYNLLNLEYLDLDNNLIHEMHPDLLLYQPDLLVFRASFNRIETINKDFFKFNPKLTQIHLNDNRLKNINFDFTTLSDLRIIDLENNLNECNFRAGKYYEDESGSVEDDEVLTMFIFQANVEKFCRINE